MSEDTDIHVFTARLPVPEFEALRALAFHGGRSINREVIAAVRSHLLAQTAYDDVEEAMEEAKARFRATLDNLGD